MTLVKWIKAQRYRNSMIGDLAVDLIADCGIDDNMTIEDVESRLNDVGACWQAMRTLAQANIAYIRSQRLSMREN